MGFGRPPLRATKVGRCSQLLGEPLERIIVIVIIVIIIIIIIIIITLGTTPEIA
jgi:hypothetical protein